MKKLLSGILILPFLFSAHTTFALSDTLQARRDTTTIIREGNTLFQETTKIIKNVKNSQVRKIYLDELSHKKTEFQNMSYSLKWENNEVRGKRIAFLRNTYFTDIQKLKKDIQENTLISQIHPDDKNRIEADILSYQQYIFTPIQEFLERYGTGSIKSTGKGAFEYTGTLGRARLNIDSIHTLQSLISDTMDLDTTLSSSVDLVIPPETSCDYNTNDDYVCTPISGTGRIAFDSVLEIGLSIRENEILITPKRFSYNTIALPSTGKYATLSGSLARIKDFFVTSQGKTTYSLPMGSSVVESLTHASNAKQIQDAKDILRLFTTTSILSPIAKNKNAYLLSGNPEFQKKLESILKQTHTKKIEVPYPPIWYKDAKIMSSWIEPHGTTGSMELSHTVAGPQIMVRFEDMVTGSWKGEYTQTGNNMTAHFENKGTTPEKTIIFDASLQNTLFQARLEMPGLETFYTNTFTYPLPTTALSLNIRGSFSLKNSNLYASLGGHDFAQIQWYYSDTASNFSAWVRAYGQEFKTSSESIQTMGNFEYKDYRTIPKADGKDLTHLFESLMNE